ncbi:hypothetical protein [Frankia sp. AiPa1]|uniref:hypothetical protein n=1 Tax=Frankia sp. AiPa1 TaxID=573492 RepID=UPI00202B86D1|nr:hypothetical protein [Frankia sp. AiPa1]MCL9758378.1 hypothetical protein [Frankia sp. AiPa1]
MGTSTDLPSSGLPLEAPDADAAEQAQEVSPPQPTPTLPVGRSGEADEFDLVEQSIDVETDEDEYR